MCRWDSRTRVRLAELESERALEIARLEHTYRMKSLRLQHATGSTERKESSAISEGKAGWLPGTEIPLGLSFSFVAAFGAADN